MGAGASAQLPDTVTLDEAKAYAGDAWTDDAQKAFDASASNGTTTKEAIAAYAQERRRAATTSNVGKEQFVASLMMLVALAVDGLPRGFRSTQGRRNKLLRNFAGDADRCCDQAFATTMSEDTIQFLVAFVPGLGACSAIIAPLWKLLRGTLLVCALRGHDLSLPQTKARVLYAMAGTKAEAVAAGAMSTVVDRVEIHQCVGCTDAAVLARSSGEEPASPRHRAVDDATIQHEGAVRS